MQTTFENYDLQTIKTDLLSVWRKAVVLFSRSSNSERAFLAHITLCFQDILEEINDHLGEGAE